MLPQQLGSAESDKHMPVGRMKSRLCGPVERSITLPINAYAIDISC
jgi:hypothetical protein